MALSRHIAIIGCGDGLDYVSRSNCKAKTYSGVCNQAGLRNGADALVMKNSRRLVFHRARSFSLLLVEPRYRCLIDTKQGRDSALRIAGCKAL